MSFFVQATVPPHPKTKNIITISLLVSAILTVLIIAQLFTFEDFPAVIASLWLPGGEVMARFLAALLVVIEVFSLPFLLSMRLSPLFRVVSMVCGWLVVVIWSAIAIWENLMAGTIANGGLLGATIPLPTGWWNVFFSLALGVLVTWVSWGMWPFRGGKSEKKL